MSVLVEGCFGFASFYANFYLRPDSTLLTTLSEIFSPRNLSMNLKDDISLLTSSLLMQGPVPI